MLSWLVFCIFEFQNTNQIMKLFLTTFSVLFLLTACGKKSEKKSENLYPEKKLSPQEQLIEQGKELFQSTKAACVSCHVLDKKTVGPGVKEIAKIYKEQKGSIFSFLREKAKPIVDPSQFGVMQTNFAIVRTFSDQEIKSLEAYILSQL